MNLQSAMIFGNTQNDMSKHETQRKLNVACIFSQILMKNLTEFFAQFTIILIEQLKSIEESIRRTY